LFVIAIFEGVNGVGKTTQAKRLAAYARVPLFKPFKPTDSTIHWGQDSALENGLKLLGVPINTHVEDLFMADFLATFRNVDCVLDRGMPSAVAYGLAQGVCESALWDAFAYWMARLSERDDVLYIHMSCNLDLARARCAGRMPCGPDLDVLIRAYDECFQRVVTSFNTISIDTTDDSPGEIHRLLVSVLARRS